MAYRINSKKCTVCGTCEEVCPAFCIYDRGDGIRTVKEDDCISCGTCVSQCPAQCISEA